LNSGRINFGPNGAGCLPTAGTSARRGGTPPAPAAPRAHLFATIERLVRERDEARADAECARQLLAYHGLEVTS